MFKSASDMLQSQPWQYLVNHIGLHAIYYPYLECLGKVDHRTFVKVDDIFHWQRYFDAIAVVVGPENDLLQGLDPFFSTFYAIGFEVVNSLARYNGKFSRIFDFVFLNVQRGRNTITQVNVSAWKIMI